MKFYDISMTIHPEMQVWENIQAIKPHFDRNTSGYVTSTTMELNLHSGTHIDAPLHMLNDGDTFESISLEKLIRKVKVLDVTNAKDGISRTDLEAHSIFEDDFLLLKTKNSSFAKNEFDFDFIYLKEDGADYLIQKQVAGVGIDTLGIERSQEGNPTHRKLFTEEIIIMEGLRLAEVTPGEYLMVAAPLKLIDTEAAPARVLLFEEGL